MTDASPVYRFTVFTPTFQRRETLSRVYDSLKMQTFKNFEWLIVDDGSSDGTADLVRVWQEESWFPIRYIWQPNAGKHVACNLGVRQAHGELFLIADSDDSFLSEALEQFNFWWNAIPLEDRSRFVGVTGNCADEKGRLVGDKFPKSPLDSNAEEVFFRYGIRGEKWGFHRTDVMRTFPFPEPKDKKFVIESYVWFRIAKRYQTRFINENLRVYYSDADNQLSKRSVFDLLPYREFYADTLNTSAGDWFKFAPFAFAKIAALYARFSFLAGEGVIAQTKNLEGRNAHMAYFLGLPVGFALACKDFLSRALSKR